MNSMEIVIDELQALILPKVNVLRNILTSDVYSTKCHEQYTLIEHSIVSTFKLLRYMIFVTLNGITKNTERFWNSQILITKCKFWNNHESFLLQKFGATI